MQHCVCDGQVGCLMAINITDAGEQSFKPFTAIVIQHLIYDSYDSKAGIVRCVWHRDTSFVGSSGMQRRDAARTKFELQALSDWAKTLEGDAVIAQAADAVASIRAGESVPHPRRFSLHESMPERKRLWSIEYFRNSKDCVHLSMRSFGGQSASESLP